MHAVSSATAPRAAITLATRPAALRPSRKVTVARAATAAAPVPQSAPAPCSSRDFATFRSVELSTNEPVPLPRLVISEASTRFMVQAETAAQVRAAQRRNDDVPSPRSIRILRNSDGTNIAMSVMLYSVSPGVYAHAVYAQARLTYQLAASKAESKPAKEHALAHSS